jgi:hypothetical protein
MQSVAVAAFCEIAVAIATRFLRNSMVHPCNNHGSNQARRDAPGL